MAACPRCGEPEHGAFACVAVLPSGRLEYETVVEFPEIKGSEAIDVLFETESLMAFTLDEPIESHLAWAAGFWDGEGHVSARRATATGGRQIKAQITQKDRRVLDTFTTVTGLGKIYPKRAYGWYSWNLARRKEVRQLAAMLWPWLGEMKREQFIQAFGVYELLGIGKGVRKQ